MLIVTFFQVRLGFNIIKGAFLKQGSSHNSAYQLRLGPSSKADQYESYCFWDQNYVNANDKLKVIEVIVNLIY